MDADTSWTDGVLLGGRGLSFGLALSFAWTDHFIVCLVVHLQIIL